MKRNPDGTWGNAWHPIVVSDRTNKARWVTAEVLACKRRGLSMALTATHISRVGQNQEQALSPVPDVVVFPPNYHFSESAVFKAYHKAMDGQPAIDESGTGDSACS